MSIRAHTTAQRLNERVRFERKTKARSAGGAVIETWVALITCHAAVDGAKAVSQEPMVDGAIRSASDYIVWVRADIISRYSITLLDRIVWRVRGQDRVLDIKDLPEQGLRGRMMAVVARSGLNAG